MSEERKWYKLRQRWMERVEPNADAAALRETRKECKVCGHKLQDETGDRCFLCEGRRRKLTDAQALIEMAAWLKGGERCVDIDHSPGGANAWQIVACTAEVEHSFITEAPSIAEAWAALKAQEGWRG